MDASPNKRVLVVDDDESLLTLYSMVLTANGFAVDRSVNAEQALELFRQFRQAVVLTDLCMPGADGVDLLRAIRQVDLDVPVVLVTASPSLDSAIRAVELGAMQYLVKPLDLDELVAVVRKAVGVGQLARLKRAALALLDGAPRAMGDRTALEVMFDSALAQLYNVYQPLVDWKNRRVMGYEALVRSREPRMPSSVALIDAAERLGRVVELGRASRDTAYPRLGEEIYNTSGTLLFLNVHPMCLEDDTLYDADSGLAAMAGRVVLEITERASLEPILDIQARLKRLRDLGFRIAVDDLGAGYAGLTTFSTLQPDVCKLDMGLVRGVDSSPTKQRIIHSMVEVCSDLNVELVAEGVETSAERDHLTDLGCNVLQGFLFAKPAVDPPLVIL